MSNGKAEFSRHVLRVGIAQICQQLGWHAIQKTPLEMLTDILERYLLEVAKTSHRYCEQFGRTEPSLDDVALAFKYIGINMGELEEYLKYFAETVPGPKDLPRLPGASAARLNMPKRGSKEALSREESDEMPSHLPIIHRDWVEEGPQSAAATPGKAEPSSSGETLADDASATEKRPSSPDTPASKKLRTLPEEAGHSQYEMTCVTMSTQGLLTPTRALGRLPDSRTPPVTARPAKTVTHYIRSNKLPDAEDVRPSLDDDDYIPTKYARKEKVTHPVLPSEAPKRGRPRKDAPKRIPKKTSSALLMEKFEERVEKKSEKERLKEKKRKHREKEKYRDSSHDKYDRHDKHHDKHRHDKKLKEHKEHRIKERKSKDRDDDHGPWSDRPKDERTRNLVKTLTVRVEEMTYHSSPLERVAPSLNQSYECSPRRREVRSPRPPAQEKKKDKEEKRIDDLEEGLRIRSPPPVSRVKMAENSPARRDIDSPVESSLMGHNPLQQAVKTEVRTTPPASPSSSPSRSSRAPSPAVSIHEGAPSDPRLAPVDPRSSHGHGGAVEEPPERSGPSQGALSLKIGGLNKDGPMVIKPEKEKKRDKKHKKKDKEKKQKHRDRESKERDGKKEKSKKKDKKEKQKVPKLTFKLGGSSPSSVASIATEETVPKLLIKPYPSQPEADRPATPLSTSSSRPITPSMGPSRSPSRSPSPVRREMSPIRFSPVEDSPVSLTAEMNLETLANVALQPGGRTSRASSPPSPLPSPRHQSPKVSPRKKVYTSSSDDDDSPVNSPTRPTLCLSPPRYRRQSSSSDSSGSRSPSPLPSPRKKISPKKGPPPTKAQLKAVPPPKKSPGRPPKKSPGRPRKHPLPESPVKAPRSPDSKKMKVMTETVGSVVDDSGQKIWICPACAMPDDGSPMIGCDNCDDWYHWPCVDITEEPSDDLWFCPRCIKTKKKKSKRGRPKNP